VGQQVGDKRILRLIGLLLRRRLFNTFAVHKAYPVGWFIGEMGQAIRSGRQLSH
jgi:hypothetical protein